MAKQKTKQIKQARLDERAEAIRRQAAAESRNRNLIIVVFAVLILGGSAALWILTTNPFTPRTTANSGWTDTSKGVPDEGHNHVDQTQTPTYQHQPPSSGDHWSGQGIAPIAAGNYATAQPAPAWIHNLEHGYIVLAYSCTTDCNAIHDQIQNFYNDIPREQNFNEIKFVATPYQGMAPKFALLAWDRELDLTTLDTNTIQGFYLKYVDHGRENLA